MANNYNDILALLKDANGNPKNEMTMTNTMKRANGIPLDFSSVQESIEKAKEYAQGPKAYVGQPISVGDTLYVVTGVAPDYIKAVGTAPEGDSASVVVEDGKLAMYGFKAASTATIPRKIVDQSGKSYIEWVALEQVVQGDGNAVVTAADNSAIKVTSSTSGNTTTYTLDVTFPELPIYAISKEVGEGVTTYKLTKDGTAVAETITVPDAYDDSAITSRVAAVEGTVAAHTTTINEVKGKVDTFFAAVENPDDVIDTLAEIQKYITDDKTGAAGMLEDIKENADAIDILNGDAATAGSVAKQVADAVTAHAQVADGKYATQAGLAEVRTIADNAAVKSEVDTALADKVSTAALTSALADYRKIDESYSKDDIDSLLEGITAGAGQTADQVASQLNVHKTESDTKFANIATAQNDQDELIQQNADAIAAINNETTGILAKAKADAASKVQELKDGQVEDNRLNIESVTTRVGNAEGRITEINTKVTALETADTTLQGNIDAEAAARRTLETTVNSHSTTITGLQTKDGELAAAIKANENKFAEYSTTAQVEAKIDEKIAGIDNTARDAKIQKNTDDIAAEAQRAKDEEARIAGLVTGNTTQIGKNTQAISEINAVLNTVSDADGINTLKELALWVEEHGKDAAEYAEGISDNADAIAILNGTADTDGSVLNIVNAAIAKIPATPIATSSTTGVVMGSEHISIEQNGAMKINMGLFTTDVLQQGSKTLVLNGGNSGIGTE